MQVLEKMAWLLPRDDLLISLDTLLSMNISGSFGYVEHETTVIET